MSDYPEHEKMAARRAELDAIGQFLEWLQQHPTFFLGEEVRYYDGFRDRWVTEQVQTSKGIAAVLAEYTGISQDKLNTEKDAMLAEIRK